LLRGPPTPTTKMDLQEGRFDKLGEKEQLSKSNPTRARMSLSLEDWAQRI